MRRSLWSVTAGLVVVACSASPETSAPGPSSPDVPAPVDGMIGPEGGTVRHASGARIVVPPGALSVRTRITLAGAPWASDETIGGRAVGPRFEAGPEGQTFLRPVEVVLPFEPSRLRPGSDAASAQIKMAPKGSNAFEALDSQIDLAAREIHTRTVHFTQFVPAQDPNPVFITTPAALPDATVGTSYAQAFSALGGTGALAWSLGAGSSLPPGLSLAGSGSLGGTPSAPSVAGFFVRVSDADGHSVQKAFGLTVIELQNPVPILAQIAPSSIPQGGAATTIGVSGSAFSPSSIVRWDGSPLPTSFVSSSELSAAVSAALQATPGQHQITVATPTPGGGVSTALPFVVASVYPNPLPVITAVAPTSTPTSNVDTQITITGSNFVPSTSASIDGRGLSTHFVSPTELWATIPAIFLTTPRDLYLTTYSPPPGGGFSAGMRRLTVTGPSLCATGWADLDDEPWNGCETDIRDGVKCVSRNQVVNTCTWTITTESPTFAYLPGTHPEAQGNSLYAITTTNLPVLDSILVGEAYFIGGPTEYRVNLTGSPPRAIVRTNGQLDVSFTTGRGDLASPPDCRVRPRWRVSCAGSGTISVPN